MPYDCTGGETVPDLWPSTTPGEPTMPYELDLDYGLAAVAEPSERAAFIRRTYSHLAGTILAFIALEVGLFFVIDHTIGRAKKLEEIGNVFLLWNYGWLCVLLLVVSLAFVGAAWLGHYWARSQTSAALRYVGLGLCVVATAVIYLPLLIIAGRCNPNVIPTAGFLTLATFGGLTITAFVTRKDFSFLAPILSVGSLIALGLIVVAIFMQFDRRTDLSRRDYQDGWVIVVFIFMQFDLGVLFAAAMVVLMSGCILLYTSNVMHHYSTDQHVAAALALFAVGAMLPWLIILRIVAQAVGMQLLLRMNRH
jgi:FtsH-binding integral membrane protein